MMQMIKLLFNLFLIVYQLHTELGVSVGSQNARSVVIEPHTRVPNWRTTEVPSVECMD